MSQSPGLRRASGWDFKCWLGLDHSCTEVVYRSLMEVVSQSRSLGGNLVKITSLQHSVAAAREAEDPASVGPPLGKPSAQAPAAETCRVLPMEN